MKFRNVEDVYPLSPMQQGMLFHSLYSPGTGIYFEQIRATLKADLDIPSFQRAWQSVVERHGILRTAFLWDGLDEPLQVVREKADLPWEVLDWRNDSESVRKDKLRRFLAKDRERGFSLDRAPLMRCTLIRWTDEISQFIWSHHHIILDGWCSAILVREAFHLYDAYLHGRKPDLDIPAPYKKYIEWLKQQDIGKAEIFWRKELRGLDSVADLRVAKTARRLDGGDGSAKCGEIFEEYRSGLSETITRDLVSLARKHRLTMNSLVEGAWALLMSRYGGEEDVLFGAAVSGRPGDLPGVETMVGLFVNSLPVRVRVSSEALLIPWLQEIQQANMERERFAFTPLVDIRKWADLPGDVPLFNVLMAFENYPIDHESVQSVEGLEVLGSEVSMEETNYPFLLQVHPGSSLEFRILFDSTRYAPEDVVRICTCLSTVLEGFASDPDRPLKAFALISEGEKERFAGEWCSAVAGHGRVGCLHRIFAERASRHPARVAVSMGSEVLTYAELDSKANGLARFLRESGVGPGVLVGLCLDRSPRLIVGILGILKAGAAYVPIDPKHPKARRAMILEDADVPVVLTEEKLLSDFPDTGARKILLDARNPEWFSDSCEDLQNDDRAERPAYVIYTSGSTGRPKGVVVTHGNVACLFAATQPRFRFSEQDVWSMFHTCSFDLSVWEIWGALLYGGRIVIVPYWVSRSPDEFYALMAEEGVTVLNQTPSSFQQISRVEEDPSNRRRLSLRWVIFGGEALDFSSLRSWFRVHGDEHPRLVNMYGITEITIHGTWRFLCEKDVDSPASLIGEPLPHLRFAIMDACGHLLPPGVPGEICVGGAGVAVGYLGMPELTRERFLPSPFGDGGSIYRSGDLARVLPDGDMAYLGRIDQQVQVRGFRIELGEIEAALSEHPWVKDQVVIARPPPEDDEASPSPEIHAYVVPDRSVLRRGGTQAVQERPDEEEIVTQWARVFQEKYGAYDCEGDPRFNISGWDSSYTARAIPEEEMREWVDNTVDRILSLSPKRTLEIGCGTGLLLSRIAPECREYCATDFSAAAIRNVERILKGSDLETYVRLLERPADDFSGMEKGTFDTIILNSVVQYFPDVEYLLKVLRGAYRLLAPGGSLFVGDVRSLPLLDAYHASVQLFRAPETMAIGSLRRNFRRARAGEEELAVSPRFFEILAESLCENCEARCLLKPGRSRNEMTRFRYDVVIRWEGERRGVPRDRWVSWESLGSMEALDQMLSDRPATPARVTRIPDARLRADAELLALLEDSGETGTTVGEIRRRLSSLRFDAVEPEDIRDLSRARGMHVEMVRSLPLNVPFFDAVFVPEDLGPGELSLSSCEHPAEAVSEDWHSLASDPRRRQWERVLIREIREQLKDRLPDYMAPAAVLILDSIPLTANGKVDRRALPVPDRSGELAREDRVAPRNQVEEILAAIWAEVLDLEEVGIHDHFFDLGGHSLLATQAISRVRTAFSAEIPLKSLFDAPTVAEFSSVVGEARLDRHGTPAPPIEKREVDGPIPLSFSQQRLWFLDRLEGPAPTYVIPAAFELVGPLHMDALAESLTEIVRRHESLRTVFEERQGVPSQRILEPERVTPGLLDLGGLPDGDLQEAVRQALESEFETPFDLARGPLFRAKLIVLGKRGHLLLLTMHHIVSDGWSMNVLANELSELYRSNATGSGEANLEELPVRYRDFARWQREWLRGPLLDEQLGFWKERLAGASDLLRLPWDRPRPSVQTFRGGTHRFRLEAALVRAMDGIVRKYGVTRFMVLLAVHALLLQRYSGEDDLLIGTPVANRNRREIETLIGFFVNTLVLRTDLSGDPPFRELLHRIRRVTLEAYDHQDVPFELVVDALQPERDLSHTPLFQTMLVLQNPPHTPAQLPGLTVSSRRIDPGVAKFDLTLAFEEDGEELEGELQYNSDLFDPVTASRIADHYKILLSNALAHAGLPLSSLSMLSESERNRVLISFNDSDDAEIGRTCVHGCFEEQARRTPDAPAVLQGECVLSFKELNARSNRLAGRLRRLGVSKDVFVGLCARRSPETLMGILAVWKAGGAYVPLDPDYPSERLRFMVEDSQSRILLIGSGLEGKVPACGLEAIPLDRSLESEGEPGFASDCDPSAAAYAIYTSGSAGMPKGVVVEHASLANLALAQIGIFDVGPQSRIFQFASLSFDVSVSDVAMAFCSGAALVLPSGDEGVPGPAMMEALKAYEVTHLEIPAPVLAAMPQEDLPALRVLVVGGEPCAPEVVKRWAYGRRLFNAYGPTEATICSSVAECDGSTWEMPIGRPLPNVRLFVLDPAGNPVPVGIPGELHIGGAGVAREYLGRPDLNAASFIASPFKEWGGERLFRTGDRVRYRADGNVEFLGRIDGQIKVRGFRIEPGEVEAALLRHPNIREAAVVATGDPRGEMRLAAFCVCDDGRRPGRDEVRAFLRKTLPAYMEPSAILFLDRLPLTPNRKVDRRALMRQEISASEDGAFEAPRNDSERIMAEIWQEVLGVEGIGVHADFFHSGGHSLSVVQVISRIRDRLHVETPLRTLFQSPVLSEFTRAVEALRRGGSPAGSSEIKRVDRSHRGRAKPEVDGNSGR